MSDHTGELRVPSQLEELEVPPGFHQVKVHCRCGAEWTALSVTPEAPRDPPRDRRCDLCIAGDEIRRRTGR
ncbi:MAG: hypothetical protein ACREL3_07080 [Gemmatimonadales bacterium]